jgi:hypothetical protein
MGRLESSCQTLRRNPPAAAAEEDVVDARTCCLATRVGCSLPPELSREEGVGVFQCRRLRSVILPVREALLLRMCNGEAGDDENNRIRPQDKTSFDSRL